MKNQQKFSCTYFLLLMTFSFPLILYSQHIESYSISDEMVDYQSIYFVNDKTGYIVGENGTILKTIDEGANWITKESPTSAKLNSVNFPTEKTGFAVGDSGIIIRTTNSGGSWSKLTPGITDNLTSIFCTSENVCYAVGGKSILKTSNGGNNWSIYPDITMSFFEVFFPNVSTGYISGHQAFLKTSNSGETWEYITFSTGFLYSVFFANSENGWSVGISSICKTTDGGQSWDFYSPGNVSLKSVHFSGTQKGYTVGKDGVIMKTSNGGDSWETVSWDGTQNLNSVFCINENLAFAVGDSGTILKIVDGQIATSAQLIHKNENDALLVFTYPNPASSVINLHLAVGSQQLAFVEIYDSTGKKLFNTQIPMGTNNFEIDVSHLKSGIYFCKLSTENECVTKKLIIQK